MKLGRHSQVCIRVEWILLKKQQSFLNKGILKMLLSIFIDYRMPCKKL